MRATVRVQITGQALFVPGGTQSSPTNLGSAISNAAYTTFILGDGFYTSASISRAGITVRAANKGGAKVAPELRLRANNVVVDGLSVTASGNGITIYNPGCQVLNCSIQGFGKTTYANGIWVYKEALNPNNRVIIRGNTLDDWGGVQYAGGIAIGMASDSQGTPSQISVEVLDNRITNGPTSGSLYSAAIQSFHPFLAMGNYVHTVGGTAFQNKAFNSIVSCNEAVNVIGDGALYNRILSGNVWEYNIVHDSDVGIDHFMGHNVVYRGNVIYNVAYLGRIKKQGIGTTNLLIERNTFYNSSAWAGWIWDTNGTPELRNILWRRNIWHTVNGSAINAASGAAGAWDETENIFWQTNRPSGTTGRTTGTSLSINPHLVNPPADFTALAPQAVGRGAPWPRSCPVPGPF